MIVTKQISLKTRGNCDIIDITAHIASQLGVAGISNGTVTLFVTGSTAGITTIEFESGLLADFKGMWERLVPQNLPYRHSDNSFSHVRASLIGPSVVVPFKDKKMTLGTWQHIVLVDFDNRPRSREIIVQIMGE